MICKNCGSDSTAVDNSQGVSYCINCGMVLEENIIVSSISFNDDGVKSVLCGKIIDIESKQVGTQYVDASYYIKNTIRSICTTMGLGNNFVECSYRYYRLLLPYNLSKGKSILYTLSACVYIVCREERTPHLLIDLSNALNIDVFKIGRSFSKIVEILSLKIPHIDPSLYIQRFVIKLKLKNPKIPSFALRVISRMNRDWITTGRRPNNLCGAALLIASRVFNEEKSIHTIAKIVHVSEATIKSRLNEIMDTSTADLSIESFNNEWLDEEEDPPVIKYGKKKYEEKVFDENKVNDNDRFICNTLNVEYDNVALCTDDEIDNNILTEEETLVRKKIWEEMYEEYMEEKEKKLRNVRVVKRKRNKKQYNTVSDVLKSLNKRVSSKINYQVIESIFDDS